MEYGFENLQFADVIARTGHSLQVVGLAQAFLSAKGKAVEAYVRALEAATASIPQAAVGVSTQIASVQTKVRPPTLGPAGGAAPEGASGVTSAPDGLSLLAGASDGIPLMGTDPGVLGGDVGGGRRSRAGTETTSGSGSSSLAGGRLEAGVASPSLGGEDGDGAGAGGFFALGSSMIRGMASGIARRVSGRGGQTDSPPLATDQSTLFTAIAALRTQTQRDIGHQVAIGRIYRTLCNELAARARSDAASRDRALSQATTVVDTVTAATQALGRANQRLRRG